MMQLYKKTFPYICWSLLLIGSFLPIWHIELEAPQYPEGLNMKIWLNGLSGSVEQINGLNHYIGMKLIIEDDFIEFQILPYIWSALLLLGLFALNNKKKSWLSIWCISMIIFATIGLYDFWMWEYDYGHNLNPMAAIKVPGMTYQPPLIGYKQLLNFLACSFPDWGGWLIIIGSCGIFLMRLNSLKKTKALVTLSISILMLSMIGSCSTSQESKPIAYNEENCTFCSMVIADNRFGVEAINRYGKYFYFDSIECLLHFIKSNKNEDKEILSTYFVSDYMTGKLLSAKEAFFLKDSTTIQSPMGESWAAFSKKQDIFTIKSAEKNIYSWEEIIK